MDGDDQKAGLPQSDRPESRGGLKALAVIIAVLALVGVCGSGALMLGLSFLSDADGQGRSVDDTSLAKRYNRVNETRPPRVLGEMLVEDSFRRIDFQPFLSRLPISLLSKSNALRLLSYFLVMLGAVLTLISRPLGPNLMLGASMCLIVHGLVEALALLHAGHHVGIEFLRDFESSYRHVIEAAGVEGEFRSPFTGFRTLRLSTIRLIDLGYYFVVTILWQIAALCLAICRPIQARTPMTPQPEVEA